MGIEVRKATPEDAEALARIGHAAFKDEPFNRVVIRLDTANASQAEEYWTWRISRLKARLERPEGHWYKAVDDETGQIVGFTGMLEPSDGKREEVPSDNSKQNWPAVVNGVMLERQDVRMSTIKKQLLGDRKDYWYIQSMAVHPDHQRRGIGQALLQADTDMADAACRDVYLEAMPVAVKLYQAAGFEIIGRMQGEDDGPDHPCMLRKPKSKP